jgi:hypothetical protein
MSCCDVICRDKVGVKSADPRLSGPPYVERLGQSIEVADRQAAINQQQSEEFKDQLAAALATHGVDNVAVDKK